MKIVCSQWRICRAQL